MNKTADINLWIIHAGKTGDADSLFRKINCCRSGEGWPPYLSREDAEKLDEVRGAL